MQDGKAGRVAQHPEEARVGRLADGPAGGFIAGYHPSTVTPLVERGQREAAAGTGAAACRYRASQFLMGKTGRYGLLVDIVRYGRFARRICYVGKDKS